MEPLDSAHQTQFNKLVRYYHIPSAVKGKETDYRTLKIMKEVFVRLQLSKGIQNRALFLYREHKKINKEKISSHTLLSAVCIHHAIREHKSPVTIKKLVETYQQLRHRVLGKTIRELRTKLGIKPIFTSSENYVSKICSIICQEPVIVDRILSKYKINVRVYEHILKLLCYRILEHIPPSDRGGKRPRPFAVSIAYVADKRFARLILNRSSVLTQKIVAKATDVAEFTVREHSEFAFKYCTDDLYADVRQHLYQHTEMKPLPEDIGEQELIKRVSNFLELPHKTMNRTLFLYENYHEVYQEVTDKVQLSALCFLFALREHNHNILPIEIITTYKLMGCRITESQLVKLLNKLELKEVETVFLQSEDYISTVCSLICSSLKVRTRVDTKYSMSIQAYKKLLLFASDQLLLKLPLSKRKLFPPYTFAVALVYTVDKHFAKYINTSSVLTFELIEDTTRILHSDIRVHIDFLSSYISNDIYRFWEDSFASFINGTKDNLIRQ